MTSRPLFRSVIVEYVVTDSSGLL